MEIPQDIDNFLKESIEASLGLPISEKNMQLKLRVLEDTRHLLQSQIFQLEDRLRLAKAEASMNAQGLRRSIEDKDKILLECAELKEQHAKLEESLRRTVDACDELEKENEELSAKLLETSSVDLTAQVESLKVEKEQLLINLNKAEEEVVLLSKENKMLESNNKRLAEQLKRLQGGHHTRFSASASAKVKGKSSIKRSTVTENEGARDPLTPIHFNSPELDSFNPSV